MIDRSKFKPALGKGKRAPIQMGLTVLLLLLVPLSAMAAPQPQSAPWWGEYFTNATLTGSPVLSRYDQDINFDWGSGSPGSDVPADNFSARWVREAWFDDGTYRFAARSDDGLRVWVGEELVIDAWYDHQASWMTRDLYIGRGTYLVRVEYYDHGGGAVVQLNWMRLYGGQGWQGEYYDNKNLKGAPALVRDDAAINFAWEGGSPDPAIPTDNFSARWTRTLSFPAGAYRFHAAADDGVRLWVDNQLLVDAWYQQELPNDHWGDLVMDDKPHQVKIEYFEGGGGAHAHVWWERLDGFSGWKGEYYDNPNMYWPPVMTRDDAEINFDWGTAPPVAWMPDDNFSIVWNREMTFVPGFYRIAVQSDDGVRVWLDDTRLMIDKWHKMDYELHYVDGTYLDGTHRFRIEYFEQSGHARIHFWVVPTPWKAEYFANPDLSGDPQIVQLHEDFNFDWSPEMRADDFSIRWTTQQNFGAGRYTFKVTSDEGVRLYIDDELVFDHWQSKYISQSVTRYLATGEHTVVLEYFKGGGGGLVLFDWQVAIKTPEEIAESFYNWYIGYGKNQGNPLASRAYRSSEYLTDSFVQKLDELVEDETLGSLAGEGYDPILCGPSFPDKVDVGGTVVSAQDAWVTVLTYWDDGAIVGETTVNLKSVSGGWKIDNILCSLAVDTVLEGWQFYHDQEYGFQVRFPQDWMLEEVKMDDPQDDVSIDSILGFSPQDWEDTVMPVSIEINVGSLEELKSTYPSLPTDHGSGTVINGYEVLIWESLYDEVFYVFEHPTDSELKVVVHDNISSLGQESNPQLDELKDVVNRMLSTFRFTE